MSSWIKRASWIVAVVVAAAFGHWLAGLFSPRPAAMSAGAIKTTLPIEVTSTDFGEVLEDSDFAWTVQLRNFGTEDIEVVRVATSCDCLQVSPQSFVLPGGGHCHSNYGSI